MAVFGQNGLVRAMWFYLGKVIVFKKLRYSDKVVIIVQNYRGCACAKWLHSGQIACF